MAMATAYDPSAWAGFLTTYAVITAALLGLLFVSLSIHAEKLVPCSSRTTRAGKAMLLLGGMLLSTVLVLIPQQRLFSLGCELVGVGLVTGLCLLLLEHCAEDSPLLPRSGRVVGSLLTVGAGLPVLFAGASLLLGRWGGLYWMCAGLIAALLAALVDVWSLLLDIRA